MAEKELSLTEFEAVKARIWPSPEDVTGKSPEGDELKEVVAFLASTDAVLLRAVLEFIGDLARQETNRNTLISHTAACHHAVRLLERSENEIPTYAVRLIGNLCFNNDESRQVVLDNNGLAPIVAMLSDVSDAKKLRMTCGAVANLCSSNETVSVAVAKLGALPLIVSLLQSPHSDVVLMAIRALQNISNTENLSRDVALSGGFYKLVEMLLAAEEEDFMVELCSSISANLESVDNAIEFVEKYSGLEYLLSAAQTYDDDDVQKAAFDLMLAVAEKDSVRIKFQERGILARLLSLATTAPAIILRQYAMRVVSELSLGDEIGPFLLQHVSQWNDILRDGDMEIKHSAGTVLANIARSDEICTGMMKSTIPETLLKVLAIDDEEGKYGQVFSVCCSALRNISLPAQNKLPLVKLGAIKAAAKIVRGENDVVAYGGVTIIKSLLGADFEPVVGELIAENVIPRLVQLADKTKKRDDHVVFESSRTISLLCILSDETRRHVAAAGGFACLATLMESKFAILQYEGILSSIKVASAGPAFVQALLDTDNFVSVLLDVVQKEETIIPEGSRPKGPNDVNVPPVALQLLSALVDTEYGAKKLSESSLKSILDKLLQDATKSADLREAARLVCEKLH